MKPLAFVLLALSLVSMLGLIGSTQKFAPVAAAAVTGKVWDNIVVIAMENTPYNAVFGTGTGNGAAPFLSSMLPSSATNPFFGGYGSAGRSINGCSAGCYVALLSGSDQGVSDGYGCCLSAPTFIDRLTSQGLTWQAYCAEGCPRGNDHFPFTAFTNTVNSGNIFTSSSVTTSNLIAAANSANPPSFLWFTPTDSENMHDNSVGSGDSYLKNFLVGGGSVASPSTGSLLASGLFTGGKRVLLVLWWDEPCGNSGCGDGNSAPNLYFGTSINKGLVSQSQAFDTFSLTRLIEDNWGMQTLTTNDAQASGLMAAFTGVSGPAPLSATISWSPTNPTPGQSVTFNGVAQGGQSPFTYAWSGAVTSSSQVVSSSFAAGTYAITLKVMDSGNPQQTVSVTQTFTVATGGCTSNCGTGGHPTSWPHIIGWGGIRLDEAAVGAGGLDPNPSNQASCCFTGETVTNMELVLQRMKALGYNGIRVDFDPTCTDNTDFQYMSAFSAGNLQRAITLAKYYGFWLILDYHGYVDAAPASSVSGTGSGPSTLIVSGYSTLQACWLGTWSAIVTQFKNSYNQLIWEALNEPQMGGAEGQNEVNLLSSAYQAWIDQDRAIGDDHWIVVGNLCSFTCAFSDYSAGYPTVTDSLAKVFTSLHSYIGFPYFSTWNNATADTYAQTFFNAVISGYQKTGWPALNTEGGADPLCSYTACPNAGWVITGSAGYTKVSFEFIRRLTQLYNTASTPINWIWWTAGSWTDSRQGVPPNPNGTPFILGSLDPQNGWGTILGVQSVGGTTCTSSGCGGGSSFLTLLYQSLPVIGAATVLGALGVLGVTARGKRGRPK